MTSQAPSLLDLEDVRRDVDDRLAAVLADRRDVLHGISADTDPLVDAWEQMLRGGKRMRAALCYWSWRAHGGDPATDARTGVVGVGAALELFQAAALFHDDVMDKSDTRRGVPTAHRTFARRHSDERWAGDGDQFGLSAAILLGDLSLVSSEDEYLAATVGFPVEAAGPARDVFTQMRTEVTVGQYLDMYAQVLPWGEDLDADEHRAREVIRAKSARYSVECPLLLGAALAGADSDALDRCSRFGLPLGEAFQLRDDLLGVFGDPRTTGKPAGDDLREGKRTVLVVRAMRALDDAARKNLSAALGRPDLGDDEIAGMQDVIARSGAVEEIEALIGALTDEAFAAFAALDLHEGPGETLAAIARSTVRRSA